MPLIKSSFPQAISSFVWSLWSTTKTIWFTPIQQESCPVEATETILRHGLKWCGVWWFETTLDVHWRKNEANSRVYLRMLERNVLPNYGNSYIFIRKGTLARTTILTQNWRKYFREFFDKLIWPLSSLDVNPMDITGSYCIVILLVSHFQVCQTWTKLLWRYRTSFSEEVVKPFSWIEIKYCGESKRWPFWIVTI